MILEISKRIRDYRKEKNLTQKQLGDRVNVSDKTISSWENGRTYPDISMIIKLAEIFELSLDNFLKEDKSIVEKISKDTSFRKKQNIKNKTLGAIIAVLLFALVYIVYQNIDLVSINKPEDIGQLTLTETDVSFDVGIPSYRSIRSYMIDSTEEEGVANLSIDTGFDWSFSNVKTMKVPLENFKGIHEIQIIDSEGNILKSALLSD